MNFNQYRNYTKKLIALAYKGELQIDEYADAYIFALRFENLLEIDPTELKEKFIKALTKNEKSFSYKKSQFFYRVTVNKNSPFFNNFEEILFKCREINSNNKNRILQKELEILFDEFKIDPHNFILTCEENIKFIENTFFSKFKFAKLWKIIGKFSNKDLIELGYVLENRFASNNVDYSTEKSFLNQLNIKIEQRINSKTTNKMSKIALKFLNEKIHVSLLKI